jgi:hypothetical protein
MAADFTAPDPAAQEGGSIGARYVSYSGLVGSGRVVMLPLVGSGSILLNLCSWYVQNKSYDIPGGCVGRRGFVW